MDNDNNNINNNSCSSNILVLFLIIKHTSPNIFYIFHYLESLKHWFQYPVLNTYIFKLYKTDT